MDRFGYNPLFMLRKAQSLSGLGQLNEAMDLINQLEKIGDNQLWRRGSLCGREAAPVPGAAFLPLRDDPIGLDRRGNHQPSAARKRAGWRALPG